MNILKKALLSISLASFAGTALAVDFFDTGRADSFFDLGVRTGINVSGSSISGGTLTYNHGSWGTGFDLGVVADINFRDWLSIQPGIFYQSRSADYTYIYDTAAGETLDVGHTLYYAFNIPVLASARFNITSKIRWQVDFGPYWSLGLGKSDKGMRVTPSEYKYKNGYYDFRNRYQWGFKMGTGLKFLNNYYFGIHYMAGCRNVYSDYGLKGRGKAWTFTVGYDL